MPLMHETWGAWPWIAPFWILFWILLVAFLVRFVFWRRGAWCSGGGGPRRTMQGPDEILAERFARGEIDATEYRSRLDVLRQ
jgi:putative membrane protein